MLAFGGDARTKAAPDGIDSDGIGTRIEARTTAGGRPFSLPTESDPPDVRVIFSMKTLDIGDQ
jgi:hypothetical protein